MQKLIIRPVVCETTGVNRVISVTDAAHEAPSVTSCDRFQVPPVRKFTNLGREISLSFDMYGNLFQERETQELRKGKGRSLHELGHTWWKSELEPRD